jgi:hypothetical protein
MRFLIPILTGLTFASTTFAQIDETDFLRHMIAHRIGVGIICDAIVKEFKGLRPAYALDRCRAHDMSKINHDAKFLEKHSLPKDRSLSSYLSEIYGRFIPETQLERGIIDEVNRVDTTIASEIDLHHRATSAERRLADMLEHVADLTERGLHENMFPPPNGIYERAKPMIPASRYFEESPVEKKKWTAAEREKMIRIAKGVEESPDIKLKLVKRINAVTVERGLQDLHSNSHFYRQRQRRAACFEALIRAPLPNF